MKKQIALSILITTFILYSCGSVSVYFSPKSSIPKESYFLVVGGADRTNSKAILENLLEESGFTIIQEKDLKQQVHSNKPIFVITLDYFDYWDIFSYNFKSFSAKIKDFKTKKTIASINFNGDRTVKSVLTKMVTKIKLHIK